MDSNSSNPDARRAVRGGMGCVDLKNITHFKGGNIASAIKLLMPQIEYGPPSGDSIGIGGGAA